MSDFIQSLGTPGGKSALVAFLWLALFVMIFVIRLMRIEITPEGITAIGDASKILLGALLWSLGAANPKEKGE